MKEQILTKEEQILVLKTQIKERALIIYVIESAILDDESTNSFPLGYKTALDDEIENHNLILSEYQEELKKLQK